MLQQTTVVTVGPYFTRFITQWPTVDALAAAELDEVLTAWAGLGYYARARNLHKCAKIVAGELGGRFPGTTEALRALPGIGPYTAAAVTSIAFNQPAVAVDGNVERVMSRFFALDEPLPFSKEKIRAGAEKLSRGNVHPGDFTQGLMELGATVCTPRKPKCGLCPWQKDCLAHQQGIAEALPRRAPKTKKPVRYGKVFWICRKSGAFLIEKREGKGLYEGMYQLPTTEWVTDKAKAKKLSPPHSRHLRFKALGRMVRHSLTHFDLVLEIWGAEPKGGFRAGRGCFVLLKDMETYAMPSLMRKAVKLCVEAKAQPL
jgi:A/G-specific adenine glycosylase